jgi:hypothetical protein
VYEVVMTMESDSGRHRARVLKLTDRTYRIEVERLLDDIDANGFNHGEFWAPLNVWESYTDTLERAREVAAENLRNAEARS